MVNETTSPQAGEPGRPSAEDLRGLPGGNTVEDPSGSLHDGEEPVAGLESDTSTLRFSSADDSYDQEGGAARLPPALDMLADSPLTTDSNDQLDFAAYANALAELLDNRKDRHTLNYRD